MAFDSYDEFQPVDLALLRFNWMPAALDGGDHLEKARHLADRAVALADDLDARRAAAADQLGRLAPLADATDRGPLLTARRDIFNGRLPRLPLPEIAAADPAVAAWVDAARDLESVRAALDEVIAQLASEERRQLAEACAAPELLRALAITSRSLYGEARRYAAAAAPAGSPATKPAKPAKSEAALLRYVDRARLRTSPFSWYTSTAVLELAADGGGAVPDLASLAGVRAHVEAGHAPLRRIVDALVTHAEVRPLLSYALADRSGADEERLTFNVTVDGRHPRVHGNREQEVAVRRTRALEGLIDWLATQDGAVPWSVLCGLVESWGGDITAVAAAAFVARLVDLGVLRPVLGLPHQAPDLLERTVAFLRSLDADVARRTADALVAAGVAITELAAGDVDGRPVAVAALEASFAAAFAAVGLEPTNVGLFYETTVAPAPVSAGIGAWGDAVHDAVDAAALLEAFDRTHTLRAVLRQEFVAQFGAGGRCKDMVAFRDVVRRSLERWGLAVIGHDPIDQTDAQLTAMADVRADLLRGYVEAGRAGRDELVIPAAAVDAMRGRVWPSGRRPWTSYSLFLQPELDGKGSVSRAVLNHMYTGIGMYPSRFLSFVDGRCTDAARARLRSLLPADRVLAEIRPTCGFNANVHPLLADVDIDVDGDGGGGGGGTAAWPAARLHVVHDVESDEVVLVDGETDRAVEVLYLGLLIPFLLPDTWAALYVLASRGPIIDPFNAPAEAARAAERDVIRSYPRVTLGRIVLERRRWYVPAEAIRAVIGDARDSELVLRLRRWARANGMPDELFVRPHEKFEVEASSLLEQIARRAPWSREKPQYLDLCSPLRVAAFAKAAGRFTDDVIFEEALPAPTSAPMDGPAGRHVAEVVLEIDRRAPSSAPSPSPAGATGGDRG
jgi:hypothetical protein